MVSTGSGAFFLIIVATFEGNEDANIIPRIIIVSDHLSRYQSNENPTCLGTIIPNIVAIYSTASLVCGALKITHPRFTINNV